MIYAEVEQPKRGVLIDKKDSQFFKDNTISIGEDGAIKIFNENIMERLLNDENLFKNLQDVLENPLISSIRIAYEVAGDMSFVGKMSKSLFTSALLKQQKKGLLVGVENAQDKISYIVSKTILPQNDEELFEENIDGKTYTIPIKELNKFILEDFKKYNLNKDFNFSGLQKLEFFYILKSYVKEYDILNMYYIPLESRDFVEGVIHDDFANTFHINEILETKDPYKDLGEINPQLFSKVIENMSSEYTPLEKAIYVYAKLCQILTYDPSYYATNQSGHLVSRSLSADAISQISPENPEVVCFEVNHIYSKFLQQLGINYEMEYKTGVYGDGHANLTFRVGEFVINADSVSSILCGDLINAKLGKRLNGLVCENENKETLFNFTKIVNAVYADVKKEPNEYMSKKKLEGLSKLYKNLAEIQEISVDKKMSLIKAHCEELGLPTTEKIASAFDVSKKIFQKEIKSGFAQAVIMSEMVAEGFNISRQPIFIVKTKTENGYVYHTFNHAGEFTLVDEAKLKSEISSGKISKIGEHTLQFGDRGGRVWLRNFAKKMKSC